MRYPGPNVVSCEVVIRLTWTPLIDAYLPLLTLDHLPDLEDSLQFFSNPIVIRDLNMDLNESRSPQSQQVVDLIV